MRHVNEASLLGVLVRDPEIRATRTGSSMCSVNLATNKNKKNKDTGEWDTETEYHRVVVFNDEFADELKNITKGSTVQFKGFLRTRKWTAQDGTDKYTTEIVVDRFGEFSFLEAPHVSPRNEAPKTKVGTNTPARSFEEDQDPPF